MTDDNPQETRRKRLMPDQAHRLLMQAVPEPPIAHAYHHFDRETRMLSYTYNNRRVIEIQIPQEGGRVSFRHGSDGTIQSRPLVQQMYVILQAPALCRVTFQMSCDTVNCRPRRARSEQAIVGQVGRPLLPGVNGLYDIDQDLLIGWHGCDWRWVSDRPEPDADGNLIAEMEAELGPSVWVIEFRPQYYRTHLGYEYHKPWERRPNLRPVVGWCTWEAYRRNVTEKDVLAATEFFSERLRPYGMEYIQIDDGFERLPLPADPKGTIADAWLEMKDEFPSGHAGVVRKIKERGMKAGVWTSASIYNDDFADAQPDCLLCDRDGRPVLGDWIRYILDCREESLEKHIRPYFIGLKKAGYEYFKIDGIRHLLYDGLQEGVLLGLLTNDEAEKRFRRFLEVGREGIGPDAFWLSSWGVLTQMVGLCDACRISQDAMPNWSGMQMQLVESARWFFTQRILFLNDPDHVCVRAPFEWSRSVLSMVSLTGGLFMLSDPLSDYDENRLELIRKCIPPLATVTAETGPLQADYAAFTWTKLHSFEVLDDKPFEREEMTDTDARNIAGRWPTVDDDHPFSSLWALHLDLDTGRWCLIGRFATLPLRATKLELSSLSLGPGSEYLAFDFWREEYLGHISGAIDLPELPLGHCQIIALRRALDRPQFLASTRHVSMDAISLKSQSWQDGTLTLGLEGVAGTTETYWIHVPKGFEVKTVAGNGLAASPGRKAADSAGGCALTIAVTFDGREREVTSGSAEITFHNQ
jgi:hypothetical protein